MAKKWQLEEKIKYFLSKGGIKYNFVGVVYLCWIFKCNFENIHIISVDSFVCIVYALHFTKKVTHSRQLSV